MVAHKYTRQTRRELLKNALALPGAFVLLSAPATLARQRLAQATPACTDDSDATLSQTAGPYYKLNSPQRMSLREPGLLGTRLVVKCWLQAAGPSV
jgi:hypothetical protein